MNKRLCIKAWRTIGTVVALLVVQPIACAAEPESVHLEVVQQARGALDGPQRWLRQLQTLSLASIRMRSARTGDRPKVDVHGQPAQAQYYVTAILTARNELQLPDTTVRQGDVRKLSEWIEQLSPSPKQEVARTPFGLTKDQLDEVRQSLATPYGRSTINDSASAVVFRLARRIQTPLVLDELARRQLARGDKLSDELQGLAEGTVLAAALRAGGLGMVPLHSTQGSTILKAVPIDQAERAWPVGWPSLRREHELVPKLMDRLPVEIVDTPLAKAIKAIQPRVEVPMAIDHYGLAQQRIVLDEVKVSFPAGTTFYRRLLDRLLFQARLEAELRIDEGDRPFLWIRPIQLR